MADWVILELSSAAEAEDPAFIRASIRSMLRNAEVFIPASVTQVGADRVITYLVDGYAFIMRTEAYLDSQYLRLEGTRYVHAVVRRPGQRRVLATISDREIDKFRQQIRRHTDQGICVGDTVVVNSGPYKNLQAVVIEDIPEQDSVQVRIELRSKDSLITLPRSFLALVSKAQLPASVLKVRSQREWWDVVRPVFQWDPSPYQSIQRLHREHQRLTGWMQQGRVAQAGVRLQSNGAACLADMRRASTQQNQLLAWLTRGEEIRSFLHAFEVSLPPTELAGVKDKHLRLSDWLSSFEAQAQELRLLSRTSAWADVSNLHKTCDDLGSWWIRFQDLARSVNSLERDMHGKVAFDNIVIDGLNLVARCALAPGLSDLSDSKGRPTGAIVGFLNSLTALRKKHPEADIWVCWDSPSSRRKVLFPEYKANRNPQRASFEVLWLKRVLPSLGVWQASAEGEEADDVIASLVKGRLAGQRTMVVSNDRDFVQLVTDRVHVLVPAMGSAKEKLVTPDQVQADYGVPSEKMLHLRAIGGDTSDNIPGAPGCGLKTASKLLQLYGTVDGIFISNLAGLSQSLRDKLRGAETQVRLNLQLMGLVADLDLRLSPATQDQTVVAQSLDDIEMNPTRLVSAFFSATTSS